MLQSNYVAFDTPQFRKLSDDQLERLHNASLEILERTGVRLYDKEALNLMRRAGVNAVDGNMVHIPPGLVEWALSIVPKRVVLCNRSGRRTMPLERSNVFFGPGSDCLYIRDHRSGERRLAVLLDVVEGVRVCDALPNIDFVMSMCFPSDVDQKAANQHQMREMLANTAKPILFVTNDLDGTRDVIEMAEIVAGGAEELRRNPICASYINVADPLRHNEEALQKLLFLAEQGLPTTYTHVVLQGMNGPVTAAGAMALANAGELVGLVLAQLKREGTPIILSGGYNDVFDMRAMRALYQAPENHHGRAEFAHYYGLPVFGLAGASDAKILDQQAAAEAAFSLLLEALRGVNLVHDLGYLEGGNCYSLEYLVVCDELVAYVKRLMQGLDVSEESLALDVIHEVGHQGDFIGTRHTRDHFRENWYPKLFDRNNFEEWSAAGGMSMRRRANEQIDAILEAHKPQPLATGVLDRIDHVVERAGR